MAAKTKRIPFDNKATEVTNGAWEWMINGTSWRYEERYGLNVGQIVNERWFPMVYVKTLNEAATYAEGYIAGVLAEQAKNAK